MKFHNLFEEKEIDFRKQVCMNFNKKKSKKEIKKETQKAYDNLYLTDKQNNNINQKGNLNIIKINLEEQ